jgi:predicted ArsR family transcriptional regulator
VENIGVLSPSAGVPADSRGSRLSSREQVLELLRGQHRPMTIVEVGERLGLHPNTVRLHLERLVEAGLVTSGRQRGEGRGRPRSIYAAAAGAGFARPRDASAPGDAGYRLLAQVLTNHLQSTAARPVEEAARAGRAWGRHLAEQRAATGPITGEPTVAEATARLAELLDELGFVAGPAIPGEAIEVHRCPFGQTSERHSPVVCAVHLGLMQGALAGGNAPMRVRRVEPFVTPGRCVARLDPARHER